MKKVLKKENLMPVVVLGLICLIVAVALGVVNHFTSQEIEKQMLIKANAGKIEVLPGLDITTMVETVPEEGKYPSEVKKISKFDVGYVIETEVKGNAAGMVVLVGIDNDGKVTGVKVLANAETPSFWSSVSSVVTGKDGKYNGQTPDTLAPEIVSGATNSSNGVYSAVKASIDAFLIAGGGEVEKEPEYVPPKSQREDSELLTLAGELVADSEGFTEVKFDTQTKYLVKVLKENGSKGYVAYVVVMSENYEGQVESETLIHIENTGKIKAVKKLVCKISDALYDYVPPTSEEVDAFYDRLPKNDSESIGNVELITNATNTSTNVRNSIKEALDVVTALIRADMPTPEEEILALAKELVGANADFENIKIDSGKYLKKIYRDKSGTGYVAYVVVISGYGYPETETLVHVGNDGKIKNVKKIVWKPSDPNPQWGFNPPAEDVVDAFYGTLNKNDKDSIDDVDLITGVTTTSSALVASIKEALEAIDTLIRADMPTSEAEIKELADTLVGGGADFEDLTPDTNKYVRKIYRDKNGKGYVAYVVVFSGYGYPETETLIHVGIDGKIKNIKKIVWKPSDPNPEWGFYPPSEDVVDAFYGMLNGQSSESIDGVDLITGVTTTSSALVASVKEALVAIDTLINNGASTPDKEVDNDNKQDGCCERDTDYTARIVGIAIVVAVVAVFTVAIIVNKKRKGGKNG